MVFFIIHLHMHGSILIVLIAPFIRKLSINQTDYNLAIIHDCAKHTLLIELEMRMAFGRLIRRSKTFGILVQKYV